MCEFCEFVTPLFNNLKIHIKKNHLEAPPVGKPRRGHKQQDEEDAEAYRAQSEHSVLNETNKKKHLEPTHEKTLQNKIPRKRVSKEKARSTSESKGKSKSNENSQLGNRVKSTSKGRPESSEKAQSKGRYNEKRSKSREQLTSKKRLITNDKIGAEKSKDDRISLRETGNGNDSPSPCKTKIGRTVNKKETEKTNLMNAEDLRIKETTRLLNSHR